jgi:hypothetical protein
VQETAKRIEEGMSRYWIILPTRQFRVGNNSSKKSSRENEIKIGVHQTVP